MTYTTLIQPTELKVLLGSGQPVVLFDCKIGRAHV